MRTSAALSVFGVRPFRIGSNEAFARELSAQLGAQGWASVLCFEETPSEPVRRFLQLSNVQLEIVEIPPRPTWKGARAFMRLLRLYRPEIVHLHFTGFLGPYVWITKACAPSARIFMTDQTSRPEQHVIRRAPVLKRLLTRMINFPVDGIVSVSDYGYRCITGLDVLPIERFTMIYNSVDLRRVCDDPDLGPQFRAKYKIPADRVLVVQVSWIIPAKGILDLLSAARLLIAAGVNVHFAFVGDGAYRPEYTQMSAEFGLADHVTWTGVVSDPFGEGVYAAADVVCQVSRWEEAFGWTIAEAMAHRKPLVGTRVGGIPEIVQDGVTGYLVDRGDVAAIADRISRLVDAPGLREEMGQAGRREVERKFELTSNVSRLLDLYRVTSSRAT